MDMFFGMIIGTAGALIGMGIVRLTDKGAHVAANLPVCACGHHYSFHGNTSCNQPNCFCRRYVGPLLDPEGNVIKEDRRP